MIGKEGITYHIKGRIPYHKNIIHNREDLNKFLEVLKKIKKENLKFMEPIFEYGLNDITSATRMAFLIGEYDRFVILIKI